MTFGMCLGRLLAGRLDPVLALFYGVTRLLGGLAVGFARWKSNERVYLDDLDQEIG